jgi:hypothetical protein
MRCVMLRVKDVTIIDRNQIVNVNSKKDKKLKIIPYYAATICKIYKTPLSIVIL